MGARRPYGRFRFFEAYILESKSHFLNTIVYIDGLNLYYSLKNTPYKWLNIKALVESALDSSWHNIVAIKYFTARVQSTLTDPSKDSRQDIFLQAVQTLQKVEIVYGKFKKRDIKAPLLIKNPEKLKQIQKVTGRNIFQFSKYEEKETDVNIATHIMYDCCYEKGFFVSWGFSPEAWEFKASIRDKQIEFFEVGLLLNSLLISGDISTEHKTLYKERVKKPFKVVKDQSAEEQRIEKELKKSEAKRKRVGKRRKKDQEV